MKYQVSNFKVSPKDYKNLKSLIQNKFHLHEFSYKILQKSIDARKKEKVVLLYKLLIETNEKITSPDVTIYKDNNIQMEYPIWKYKDRPVIIGFGPSGMFASLYLARCKANPIIIERGSKIEDRKKRVEDFLKDKVLSNNSNVQFGEGGAGTFSDGKLTTNLKDPYINFILNEFYIHGAKEDILYDAKPYIGTDYLEQIVKNIRLEIESLGGEFYFDTTFYKLEEKNDSVIVYAKGEKEFQFKTSHVLLGIGHSAKDTNRYLYNEIGLNMEQKQFSMGVRIEHKREKIDYAQYGEFSKYLPSAYYKLAAHNSDGRGVYTFCMCPGGYVLASQSDNNTIVVNGMSNNDRLGENSNSAILVDVKPSDYDKGNVLDGIDYQEKYEKLAYEISKDYKAPANLVSEFLAGKVDNSLRSINTTYPHGIIFTDFNKCLPDFVVSNIKFGIKEFDKKLHGFNDPDAILIGIESRSSSPVRIIRDLNRKSSNPYIYPMGEGAGYAGGITSAALDGLKTAMENLRENSHE
jgi:uncharacterized FAD-dependent dehydrogenase